MKTVVVSLPPREAIKVLAAYEEAAEGQTHLIIEDANKRVQLRLVDNGNYTEHEILLRPDGTWEMLAPVAIDTEG